MAFLSPVGSSAAVLAVPALATVLSGGAALGGFAPHYAAAMTTGATISDSPALGSLWDKVPHGGSEILAARITHLPG
jgi:hypothetical protein